MLTAIQIIALRMPGVVIDPGYLELAEARIPCSVDVSSQDYQTMLALMAMHLYTMDQARAGGASGSGVVDSEKEGDLSISYAMVDGVNGDLASTPWGVEYSGYARAYSINVFTRFSSVCNG